MWSNLTATTKALFSALTFQQIKQTGRQFVLLLRTVEAVAVVDSGELLATSARHTRSNSNSIKVDLLNLFEQQCANDNNNNNNNSFYISYCLSLFAEVQWPLDQFKSILFHSSELYLAIRAAFYLARKRSR